ncbi:MAG: hypothetical protein A4E44_02143 [Methanosaeta sp. PtaB.Bin018]|jgi:hypothetical protein|nr:hypothetical protein [Methanothrix sp.]OPX74168.1 MAG: hypothetical protein A4E44_02143 [Methanosaeta sp. PtaB.Bin018]HOV51477.1 hypothetical protein [Methanothrix sp.]
MAESIKEQGSAGSLEIPKKLGRAVKRLAEQGEDPVLIAPALLRSQATEQMLTIARMGMLDKVLGYLVTTRKSVHFIRPGLAWDRVQSIPLDAIDGVEYVDEFHNNTLKLKVGEKAESIIFYDDMDGIRFYKYIKDRTRR